jgi:hypothetical protein
MFFNYQELYQTNSARDSSIGGAWQKSAEPGNRRRGAGRGRSGRAEALPVPAKPAGEKVGSALSLLQSVKNTDRF